MTESPTFPRYIPRAEESLVLDAAQRVVEGTGAPGVVLLYGAGGSGKTQLVRHLASAGDVGASRLRWVEPLDMDDPEFWLLTNLEKRIASALDPDNVYFAAYLDDVSNLAWHTDPAAPPDAALEYLRRAKRRFIACYEAYLDATGNVPVVSLDTMESVRDTHLLLTLTQWIKTLPRTVFILSSRPPAGRPGSRDWMRSELRDPHYRVDVDEIHLEGFSHGVAMTYLSASRVAGVLDDDQRDAVVHLTRGQPLWLALAVEYLQDVGLPEEVQSVDVGQIRRRLPFGGEMGPEGASLYEDVKRRLLAPYRSTDFWHETVKRLAVVRQSLAEDTWRELMDDREPPDGLSWSEAWQRLLSVPWIRPRANGRQVTLHDVLAEELSWRIIPLHDQDGSWRDGLWRKAQAIFERRVDAARRTRPSEARPTLPSEVPEDEVSRRAEDQAQVSLLHYSLLSDPEEGSRRFLVMFDDASASNEVFRQELLVLEMHRFLPPATETVTAMGWSADATRRYQEWLTTDVGKSLLLEVATRVASLITATGQAPSALEQQVAYFLTTTGQVSSALELLRLLSSDIADPRQRYWLSNRLGNTCMRLPETVHEAEQHFQEALSWVESFPEDERVQRRAEAHKELGFYYRNIGQWTKADASYRRAVEAMAGTLPQQATDEERGELASVYTNWAYVKALSGGYTEAESLVDTAIKIRRSVGWKVGLGISLSVRGEILRYERKYVSAWRSLVESEKIFESASNWHWLGVVYQEQAILLLQGVQAGFDLIEDPMRESRDRITEALDLCREQNLRSYPSALNRAGRIFGADDPTVGLAYLREGIEQAQTLADGRFYVASLVEFAEFSYRLWQETDDPAHLEAIRERESEISTATLEFPFADLEGRWCLMRAYLLVWDQLSGGTEGRMREAVDLVAEGLGRIAQSAVGSHGIAALPQEFAQLKTVIKKLSITEREEWYVALRTRWGDPVHGDASLLARLQELYIEL